MSNKLFAGVLGAVMAVGTSVAPVRAASAGFLDQRDSTKSGQLGEATVSALGVQGSKDKKGIASVSVAGGSVQKSGESGIIQGLSGKGSGISITRNSGDPGAGAFIQIRGQSTITGSLQPLIVVDGIPVSNSSVGQGVDGVVQQSRLNDLNPDDIASVEVLKGAAAAAVWGTRAANGVIMITTKKGKANAKGYSVEARYSVGVDRINREYEKQSTFGQGSYGNYSPTSALSWGDRIADRKGGADSVNTSGAYFEAADGTKYYPTIQKNSREVFNQANRDQVFRDGLTMDKSISLSGGSERGNLFVSVSDWDQKGVMNGMSDYRRTTGRINFTNNLNNNLRVGVNTFVSKVSSNRVQQGSNLNGLYLGYLRTPADFDNTDYTGTYYNAAGVPTFNAHRAYRRYLGNAAPSYNNPGWTLNKQVNTSEVNRVIVTPELNLRWGGVHQLTARYGMDFSADDRITYFPVLSAGSYANGQLTDESIQESESSLLVFDRANYKLNEQTNMAVTVGYTTNARRFRSIGGTAFNFIIRDQERFSFNNTTTANSNPFNNRSYVINNRGYAVVNLDWKDRFFVELTGAAEAASTFKGQFFYPSANVAYDLTKDLNMDPSGLSFFKLRGSAGTVGVEPPAYIWTTNYVSASSTSGWGEVLDASYYGGSLYRSTIQGNPDIAPERKTEYEVGFDARFLNNKLSLSGTYYQNVTTGAIFAVDVPASTGFSSKWDNAATISNRGLEFDAKLDVVDTRDFKWNLFGNWTRNRNNVDDLKGVQSIFLAGFTGASSRAVEGHALGALWGGKWERDASGALVLDENGFPQQAISEGVLGDPNPGYRAGYGTSLTYKGVSMNVLFETSQGQQMWAGTTGVLNYFGIDPVTANEQTVSAEQAADLKNIYGESVADVTTANADGSYTFRGNIKDFGAGNVWLDQEWYTGLGGGFGPVAEDFIVDGSWTRLRELSLGYSVPRATAKRMGLSSLDLGFTGRNLLLWSPFKGVDPELNLTGVSNGRGLDYFTNPGTKSFIFSVRLGL
jgi:TonB-linked SusC/RagA family outer membrane protein